MLIHNVGFLNIMSATEENINASIVEGYILPENQLLWDSTNNRLYFGNGIDTIEGLKNNSLYKDLPESIMNEPDKSLKYHLSTILIKCGTNDAIEAIKDEPGYLSLGEPLFNVDNNTIQIGDGRRSISELPIIGTSMVDAPADGKVYVRSNNSWRAITITDLE